MKKLILFLLLPLWTMAQTSTGQEQEFDYGIKNNSAQTITTPPYLTTTGMDGTQGKIPSALIEKTDNKQNSLAVDGTGTKYPTVDAVNAALPVLQAQINSKADLDGSGKVPLTQINDALLGSVNYKGTYNANTDTPAIPTAASSNKGWYYVVSTAGTQQGFNFVNGDWIISNGTSWGKVDNNNTVASVNGQVGAVNLTKSDVGLSNVDNTSDVNKPISTATQTALNLKQNTLTNPITGTGTINYIPKFTGTNSIGNSIAYFDTDGLIIKETNPSTYSSFTLRNDTSTANIQFGIYNSLNGNANKGFIFGSGTLSELGFYVGAVKRLNILDNGNASFSNNLSVGGSISATALTLSTTPTTSSETYDFVTRNTTTGVVEKVLSNTIATTNSPAFTGTPTAPTAAVGTTGNQIATMEALQAAKQDLQSVLDKGSDATIWSQNGFNKNEIYLDVNNTNQSLVIAGAMYNIPGVINARQGGFSITDGNPEWYRDINNNKTSVRYTDPIANSILLLPAKSEGTYTLATLDDLSKRYTVSSLPTPTGSDPVFAIVTDAIAPTYLGTLTGGGSVVCPVFYNGTAWVAH